MEEPTAFTVMVTGQVEYAQLSFCSAAYCKYQLLHGEDWTFLDGLEDGITQTAKVVFGVDSRLVWSFPLDATYRSTNAFGWPQLVLTVYGPDYLGRDIVQGYGCIHLPTCSGRYKIRVQLWKPQSSTFLRSLLGFLTGMPPEFADPRFPAFSTSRHVAKVVSDGYVVVQLNVMTKDMELFGYDDGSRISPAAVTRQLS